MQDNLIKNTTFYLVTNDSYLYKELDLGVIDIINFAPDEVEAQDVFDFSANNLSLSSWWRTPEALFVGDQSNIPDLSVWVDGTIVLSPKAFRILGELLSSYGEFLPVLSNGEEHKIFNCRVFGHDDLDNCHKNRDGIVSQISFIESSDEFPLFKSDFEGGFSLFCNSLFFDVIQKYQLSGLIFNTNLIHHFDID